MHLIIQSASLSSQKCEIWPTLANLHPNEYSQEFHYYPSSGKLDRCVGSCISLNDLYNKVCVPNKTADLKLFLINIVMISMMSANLVTLGLLKVKAFWSKGDDVIIFVYVVTKIISSHDSIYVVNVVMWPKFDN